jgi:hypothetical protein
MKRTIVADASGYERAYNSEASLFAPVEASVNITEQWQRPCAGMIPSTPMVLITTRIATVSVWYGYCWCAYERKGRWAERDLPRSLLSSPCHSIWALPSIYPLFDNKYTSPGCRHWCCILGSGQRYWSRRHPCLLCQRHEPEISDAAQILPIANINKLTSCASLLCTLKRKRTLYFP